MGPVVVVRLTVGFNILLVTIGVNKRKPRYSTDLCRLLYTSNRGLSLTDAAFASKFKHPNAFYLFLMAISGSRL